MLTAYHDASGVPTYVFEVGDWVRIKSYSRMSEEVGCTPDSLILNVNSVVPFVKDMEYLCGKEFQITDIEEHRVYTVVRGFDEAEDGGWTICEEMLEPILVKVCGDNELEVADELECSDELDIFLAEMFGNEG